MSVLIEFAIFPLDKGESVSAYVSQVVELIRRSGFDYRLTAMGTLIETEEIGQALELVKRSSELLQGQGCKRVYSTVKLDIREGKQGRMQGKVDSIEARITDASQSKGEER